MAIENILITEEEKINMIPYKTYILIIMFLIQIFEIYIKYRQYRRLGESRPIPKELISLGLDKLKYEESQKYQLAKIKFKIILNITKNAMSLLFLYFDLNPLQYNISRKLCTLSRKLCTFIPLIKFNPDNEYGPLFYFIFFELISEEIIDLPFELYETFVLEEKFGFNKTTLNTFIKDQIKTFILFLIILPIKLSFYF